MIMARWVAVILAGLAVLLPASGNAEAKIRFVSLTSINKAPPGLVAEHKGLFEKHGVKVEMKLFTEGRAAIEAMAAGQFDIGMFGDIPGFALLAEGFQGKIIASGLGGPKRQALTVAVDSAYKSLKDLKGKRIGLTKGSTDEIALEATMRKQGLKWSDFEIVNLRPPEKAAVLKTNAVDAIEAWEPVPSIIVVNGIGRRLLTADGDIPDIVGVVIATDAILKGSGDAVVRFLKALHEGAVYAQAHPNEMVGFLSEKLNVKREILIQAIPTQWWYIEAYSDTLANWQTSADLLHRIGRVKKPIKVSELTDFSYLSKALGKSYPLGMATGQVMHYPEVTTK